MIQTDPRNDGQELIVHIIRGIQSAPQSGLNDAVVWLFFCKTE